MFNFKKLKVPDGGQKEIVAYKSWVVRWESVVPRGFSYGTKENMEIFPSLEDARAFRDALENARKLLKDADRCIRIEENQERLSTQEV